MNPRPGSSGRASGSTSHRGTAVGSPAARSRMRPSAAAGQPASAAAGRRRAQRGSASLIGLALCAFVVIAALVTADVGALAVARARAETAADLAALAAVTPRLAASGPGAAEPGGPGSPAERAHLVAASNGAVVVACSCDPLDSTITVRVQARLIPFGATVAVRGYARAVLAVGSAPASSGGEPAAPSDNFQEREHRGTSSARSAA